MKPPSNERRTRRILIESFGAIVVLLVIGQVLGFLEWRDIEHEVAGIERNALTSIELIARMGNDIQRERILIDRHIFEHDVARMKEVELQIDAIKADRDAAAYAYAPLVTFPGEAGAWHAFMAHAADAERQTRDALRLSRQDRDVEATRLLVAAEPTFDAISRDMSTLTAINDTEAETARGQATRLHRHLLELGFGLGLGVIVLTAIVGVQVTRVISRTERQLRVQTAELEDKNRELDAFAGRVAHDVRGPLNTISLAVSMLPPESGASAVMRRGIGQMTTLLDDLLRLSRAGGPIESASARIEAVADTVAADLAPKVAGAGGTLRVDVAPASVRGTEALLRQALWNLAENALKYRRDDVPPAIAIVGRATPVRYTLEITDNGRGMAPDEVPRAFEPFFRGADTRTTTEGTGLGLAIVRRIIEANGGAITIASQRDHGTTISIRIPNAPAEHSANP